MSKVIVIVCDSIIMIMLILVAMEMYKIEREIDVIKIYNSLYSAAMENSSNPTGLYYNNTFCVKIKGRSYSEVMETCNHEYLHYRYDNHFEE